MHPEIGKKDNTKEYANYDHYKTPLRGLRDLCIPFREKKINRENKQQYGEAEKKRHWQAIQYFTDKSVLPDPLSFPIPDELLILFRQHSAKLR